MQIYGNGQHGIHVLNTGSHSTSINECYGAKVVQLLSPKGKVIENPVYAPGLSRKVVSSPPCTAGSVYKHTRDGGRPATFFSFSISITIQTVNYLQ